jgi:hypothetical protein
VLTRLLEAASEPVQVGDACLQISASVASPTKCRWGRV